MLASRMATLIASADNTESFCGNSITSSVTMKPPVGSVHHFDDGRFYMLVVVGEVVSTEQLKCAIEDIEKGICSWDINLIDCNLDQELKLFVSRHSARFSTEVRGQKILHHKSSVLETVVLINPSDETLNSEVRLLIADAARHKMLVLAGQCLENTGELILQLGSFSFFNFFDIFMDQEIEELLSTIHPSNKPNLNIFCPKHGEWKNSNLDKHKLQDFINIKLNSSPILPEMEGLSEFTEYLLESVEIPSSFDILEPPSSGGFLKLSKPCCYIFPGGQGDSALFAVNGFNMLVNGGSDRKSCFWKLVRHLDRVDSILLTHIGDDNLLGINSMLQRKIAELEVEESKGSTTVYESTKNFISPDLGVVFLNAPQTLENPEPNYRVRKNIVEAALTMQYLSKLSLKPEPLQRNTGNTIEPIILFQKMGVGKLEMYVLTPAKNSKELEYFKKQWTASENSRASSLLSNENESELPISYLSSISSLIVWHPTNPSEKIVRVLFPGNATQYNILEGLEKLKHLDFLKYPIITEKELSSNMAPGLNQAKVNHKTDSKESLKSLLKSSPNKVIKKVSNEPPEKAQKYSKGSQEVLLKTEKKEKSLGKQATTERVLKPKTEQSSKMETLVKQKVDTKPKLTPKDKTAKQEVRKVVNKIKNDKSVDETLDKPTPKRDMVNDKLKKKDIKKQGKKQDTGKDLPVKDPKKEEVKKDEKESKKDFKKHASSKKSTSSTSEVKKPALNLKEPTQGKKIGSPIKSKDKNNIKLLKKDNGKSVSKTVAAESFLVETHTTSNITNPEPLEDEISLMSSPEDLTKDFEALKAEEFIEGNENIHQAELEDFMVGKIIQQQEINGCSDYPKNDDFDQLLATKAEVESQEVETEQITNEIKCEVYSESEFYKEKEDTEDMGEHEQGMDECVPEEEVQKEIKKGNLNNTGVAEAKNHEIEEENLAVDAYKSPVTVSPADSIHDKALPVRSDNDLVSDDENRDEPPEEYTTSAHTQSTIEISSVPTPMDEMLTPRDIMSDETTNEETESPSQDLVKNLIECDQKKKTALQDIPEVDHSKSAATEGHDYEVSASTVSPASSLEEDRSHKDFFRKHSSFASEDPVDASTVLPLVCSPSADQNVCFDHINTNVSSPVELGTIFMMSSGIQDCVNSSENRTLDDTSSPQSPGHTPYYQSPVEELTETMSFKQATINQGPIIVELINDKKNCLKEASPIDEAVPISSAEKNLPSDCSSAACGPALLNEGKPLFVHQPAAQICHDKTSQSVDRFSNLSSLSSFDTMHFIQIKEDSKMSISEGTTSDKSGTPDEVVAEDTFSHIASASTASLATSSLPEPTTDDVSPSLHAEVGSPHSTEVDDSLSVSVVQTPTTMHDTEVSPSKEENLQPMAISPDVSPKTTKLRTHQQNTKDPEYCTKSVEFRLESPGHSSSFDLFTQSSELLASGGAVTENGPTEVDYSPSDGADLRSGEMCRQARTVGKPILFEETETSRAASVSPSDDSQSTPSVITPSQSGPIEMLPNAGSNSESVTPIISSHNQSPLSPDISPILSSANQNIASDNSIFGSKDTRPKAVSLSSPNSCPPGRTDAVITDRDIGGSHAESKSPISPLLSSLSHSILPVSPNQEFSRFCFNNDAKEICTGSTGDPDSSKKNVFPPSRTNVDLCLVPSCEYKHPKTELSPSFINPNPLEYFINEENPLQEEKPFKSRGGSPQSGKKQLNSQHEETPPTSVSESAPSQTDSDVPPETEECPSITADANIDSEDDSETLPRDKTITYRHSDPPPVPSLDSAPAPFFPNVCMVDPEVLKAEENNNRRDEKKGKKRKPIKKTNLSSSATKNGVSKTSVIKELKTPLKRFTEGKDAKNATNTSASRDAKTSEKHNDNTGLPVPDCPPMYMDLVYIPNHCSAKNVDKEFFKRIRSSYYVVSGNNPTLQEPSRAVLDALLEGKAQWGKNMQVTLIPTHDTDVMREWYQETHEKQQNLNIMVLASSSTVVMQDESFPACKIEL
ncbi:microtubule-associated protein 1B [Trichomycterus rosablanca]|uniref:microtubule-associated protein 1B n=1 Tax=Trichomycterus rosablanca TaxID=2290929 RepID=UPI002F35A494